ncbi:metallophosphoesterase family protein [Trueperella pyogenes]|uniref:metallophosphoesterase family protein n=1 Tax=Trueperella pyogenes TaxID=1661 RepID=UPI003DA9A6EA
MRFLHTADWHLGRTLHGADLTPAFEQWCEHAVDLVASERVDALFISGDVYDRGIPPVTMVDLLSETLTRLLEHTRVIMTSGNHDSAQRLGFGAGLTRERIAHLHGLAPRSYPSFYSRRRTRCARLFHPLPRSRHGTRPARR